MKNVIFTITPGFFLLYFRYFHTALSVKLWHFSSEHSSQSLLDEKCHFYIDINLHHLLFIGILFYRFLKLWQISSTTFYAFTDEICHFSNVFAYFVFLHCISLLQLWHFSSDNNSIFALDEKCHFIFYSSLNVIFF